MDSKIKSHKRKACPLHAHHHFRQKSKNRPPISTTADDDSGNNGFFETSFNAFPLSQTRQPVSTHWTLSMLQASQVPSDTDKKQVNFINTPTFIARALLHSFFPTPCNAAVPLKPIIVNTAAVEVEPRLEVIPQPTIQRTTSVDIFTGKPVLDAKNDSSEGESMDGSQDLFMLNKAAP